MGNNILDSGDLSEDDGPARYSLVVYNVYGDESYDEKKAKVFTVAGLFGSDSEWAEVKKNWVDITKGDEIHANTLDATNPEKYKSLVQVLVKSNIFGWGACMSLEGYDEIFQHPIKNLPYYFCFGKVIEHFASFTKFILPQDRVQFTFDRNLETQYNATYIYDYMSRLPEWEERQFVSDEISFSSRKNPKIQCADLWTREVMKDGERRFFTNSLRLRLSIEALINTKRFAGDFYAREHFEGMKRRFIENPEPGHSLHQYDSWREKYRMQDTTENRIRYHIYLNVIGENYRDMTKDSQEYKNFDYAMRELLKVPRSVVKEKLEEEDQSKKREKSKNSPASDREEA